MPVDVLLEEAADRLGPTALAHGIPLQVRPDVRRSRWCVRPGQIVSALTNLLDNAVKYSEQGEPVDGRHRARRRLT